MVSQITSPRESERCLFESSAFNLSALVSQQANQQRRPTDVFIWAKREVTDNTCPWTHIIFQSLHQLSIDSPSKCSCTRIDARISCTKMAANGFISIQRTELGALFLEIQLQSSREYTWKKMSPPRCVSFYGRAVGVEEAAVEDDRRCQVSQLKSPSPLKPRLRWVGRLAGTLTDGLVSVFLFVDCKRVLAY